MYVIQIADEGSTPPLIGDVKFPKINLLTPSLPPFKDIIDELETETALNI